MTKLSATLNKSITKKYSLQFLPISLNQLLKKSKIDYKKVILKTDYIIDIVHNLILKYYFKNDNSFVLNSTVLKDKYGHIYNYYIQYLVDNGIITLKQNYLKGKISRTYILNPDILSQEILRYRNYDKILLKKLNGRNQIESSNLIDSMVCDKLISDLYSVKIQYDKTIFYLDTLKEESIYTRNRYSVESINEGHIFHHFDNYGRMHSNFTILKSFIRKNCLLIGDEETCEIDIPNSQPLFLSKLIMDMKYPVDSKEFDFFSLLVRKGKYYQYLVDTLKLDSKSQAKELTYKVLFGKNHKNSKWDKCFSDIFPTIYLFIKNYKKTHGDYKILAYDLQKRESNLIFNDIIKTIILINPDIKIITIHDSIMVAKRWKNFVENIFQIKMSENFNN